MEGNTCTGYVFGRDLVQARIYNKSLRVKELEQDWYGELLKQHHGEAYDPACPCGV